MDDIIRLRNFSLARISLARDIHELNIKDLTAEEYNRQYKELSEKHKAVCKELSDEIKKLNEEIQQYKRFFEVIEFWAKDQGMEWYYIKERVRKGRGPQSIKDFVNCFIILENKEDEDAREHVRKMLGLIK